ncbi:hypothetical protein [Lacinutrix jangbogonensis]|uniref:hypothetical protein n=1 Tax=Lacinutrix jangbogonensis TaxID=1469557 RepID=UPI00053EE1AF|nr:hypothetical protein [Lacinutrix jangbogonensis]
MRQLFIILFFSLFIISCSKNPESYIDHIDGYWEIESVTLSNGSKKEYTVNQTIDYISINDSLKGFRKKMNPRFDGKYETSKDAESLHIKIENDSLNLYYFTKYANWKETVLMANENQLKIVNQNNNVYLYKRFTPIIGE